jgi:hypothetical protein
MVGGTFLFLGLIMKKRPSIWWWIPLIYMNRGFQEGGGSLYVWNHSNSTLIVEPLSLFHVDYHPYYTHIMMITEPAGSSTNNGAQITITEHQDIIQSTEHREQNTYNIAQSTEQKSQITEHISRTQQRARDY